jgi:hypothetical protein
MAKDERYDNTRKLRQLEGSLLANVEIFGDRLAKKLGYKEHDGIEAIWFYLVEKYHWTPATVRALNGEDLRFLMAEEMKGWVLPPEARPERG